MAELSAPWLLLVLAAAAAVIAIAGTRLARVADQLADLTGLGEALFGALFLGAATSLPGVVTTVVAASEGHTDLAIGNALGGIAAQTAFLAAADFAYERANLEHASASLANLVQAALLVALLCIPLTAAEVAAFAELPVHPATPVLLGAYVMGIRLASRARAAPLWRPTATDETKADVPDGATLREGRTGQRWLAFALLAGVVACAGWVVAQAGMALSGRTGISETVVGVVLTAVITSLPELITTVAAARQGAVTLAVSDIIGGNSFDVLFLVAADVAFLKGSIYHRLTGQHRLFIAVSILMTAILILGMLRRERHGVANIGFESALLLLVYFAAVGWLAAGG